MALFRTQETYAALDTVGENIFVTDQHFNIVWINQYADNLIQKLSKLIHIQSRNDLIGKNISMLYGSNDENQKEIFHKGPYPYEAKIHLFNRYTMRIFIEQLVIQEKLKGYVLTWRDVTEYEQKLADVKLAEKKAEELLHRAEKLSVMGELAAGVAHEIRNPLTSIKGLTQLVADNKYKDIILDEIERINFIVNEFMLLAKPKTVKFTKTNIIDLLNRVISLLESESNLRNIDFHLASDHDAIIVECEENQLKQVFLNVMKNGIEAMPNKGNIAVDVRKKENMVEVSIADEGIGIAPEHIRRLGEPFFSTKEDGNGLGLMVSYRIVQNHSGSIQVKSEVDKGTTFTVSLPLTYSHRR